MALITRFFGRLARPFERHPVDGVVRVERRPFLQSIIRRRTVRETVTRFYRSERFADVVQIKKRM